MRLAVLTRRQDPFSLRHYRENVLRELQGFGVGVASFKETSRVPEDWDLIWDPGLAGARVPAQTLKEARVPLVATVHGAGPFSMGWREHYRGIPHAIRGRLQNRRARRAWKWFGEKVSSVIAVSVYGAQEVSRTFSLPESKVHPIYHGVDHKIFHPSADSASREKPYLLQVSQYRPKKNVERVLDAYTLWREGTKPDLVAILPDYAGNRKTQEHNVHLVQENRTPEELANLYRGAMGLVFPSLHETFGMPILEAMACGCPVITSNSTACAEVSGDAALLVNPRSVDDISSAMRRLAEDEGLRQELRRRGIERAEKFTWRRSAEQHLEVFEQVLRDKS